MTDHPESADVLVVGGGMAGLAMALVTRRQGAEVTLVEQALEFGEIGAGLQMAPNATRVLGRLGSDLHRVLLEACIEAGVRLINNVHIDRVETTDGIGRAYASSGDVYEARMILGADGLKSTLRPAVVADDPVASAFVAYRGTVSITKETLDSDLENVVVYLGPDCHLVQYPLRHGELLNTVAVFKSRSFERGEEQYGGLDEHEEAYKDCVPAVRDALKNLGTTVRWPMYDKEPIESWNSGRMLLVGDAAHPMLQYLAQGACQALEDAAELQELSAGTVFTDDGIDDDAWDEVIRAFVERRAPRTARVQRTARLWGESWHVSGVGRILRNMLFQDSRDSNFDYTDWLWGESGERLSHASPISRQSASTSAFTSSASLTTAP